MHNIGSRIDIEFLNEFFKKRQNEREDWRNKEGERKEERERRRKGVNRRV